MFRRGSLALFFVVLTLGCDASDSASVSASSAAPRTSSGTAADEAAVAQVFIDYRTAVVAKRGDDAVKVVAARTIDYYEAVRKSALTAPEAELRKAPLNDRFMIVLIRAQVEAAELRKMNGRTLFAHAVDRGLVGDGTQSIEPDRVVIRGDEASMGARARGAVVPPERGFRLYREGGSWKLDVLSIMGTTNPSIELMLKKIDPDVDVAMVKIAEQLADRPLAATIWLAPDAPQ